MSGLDRITSLRLPYHPLLICSFELFDHSTNQNSLCGHYIPVLLYQWSQNHAGTELSSNSRHRTKTLNISIQIAAFRPLVLIRKSVNGAGKYLDAPQYPEGKPFLVVSFLIPRRVFYPSWFISRSEGNFKQQELKKTDIKSKNRTKVFRIRFPQVQSSRKKNTDVIFRGVSHDVIKKHFLSS